MEKVLDILMKRDGLSKEEAEIVIDDVKSQIEEAIEEGRIFDVEEIILSELGLEPDYMEELIDF